MQYKLVAAIAATAALIALSACNKADEATAKAKTAPVTAPAGTNWLETVGKTADLGMVMGNPNAPVKLIEYGALSCPHCARFSKESREKLKTYISKGSVSYEFRTFLIHPQDVPASLLARCNGAGPFFAIAEQKLGGRNWTAGEYSIADIHLFRLFWRWMNSGGPEPGSFPGISAHYDRMMMRPAVLRVLEIESAIGYQLPA